MAYFAGVAMGTAVGAESARARATRTGPFKPFFTAAWQGILLAKPGMDLPVAIAIGLAYIASCYATITKSGDVYFDSVTMFTFLLLTGHYLEMRARHYSGRLSVNLSSLLPSTATRVCSSIDTRRQTNHIVIPIFKIKKGSLICSD